MNVYQDPDGGFSKPRVHPYIGLRPRETGFIDFKLNPERIQEVLEDFIGLSHEPAIQSFYQFLVWLNGPASVLESCDSALRGPEPHRFKYSKRKLCVHGRLMLMHRDLAVNCDDRFNKLYNTLGRELSTVDPDFSRVHGIVGFSPSRAIFRGLIPTYEHEDNYISRPGDPGRGYQLMLAYKAFGNDENEAFKSLGRVFRNIETACKATSKKLQA